MAVFLIEGLRDFIYTGKEAEQLEDTIDKALIGNTARRLSVAGVADVTPSGFPGILSVQVEQTATGDEIARLIQVKQGGNSRLTINDENTAAVIGLGRRLAAGVTISVERILFYKPEPKGNNAVKSNPKILVGV